MTIVRRLAIFAALVAAAVAIPVSLAGANTPRHPHPTYALRHARSCRVGFEKRTERHKVRIHGRLEMRRYVACVYVPAVQPRAAIDPDYTQNATNPLDVTWTYSASVPSGSLPTGVLEFFWGPTAQSQTLGCSMNVGPSLAGGKCEVILPAYGDETITVQYLSGRSSATASETENIQNPNPIPSGPTGVVAPIGNTGTVTTTAPVTTTTTAPSGSGGGFNVSPTTTTTTTVPPVATVTYLSALAPTVQSPGYASVIVQASGSLSTDQHPTGTYQFSIDGTPANDTAVWPRCGTVAQPGASSALCQFSGSPNSNCFGSAATADNQQGICDIDYLQPGTHTITITWTSTDPNYASATASRPVTVTVS